jgi:hypothetical protein
LAEIVNVAYGPAAETVLKNADPWYLVWLLLLGEMNASEK